MVTVGNAKYIGRRSGATERGTWYQISIVYDGEPVSLRCRPAVYEACGNLDFGEDIAFNLESRLFNRDWVLQIVSLVE